MFFKAAVLFYISVFNTLKKKIYEQIFLIKKCKLCLVKKRLNSYIMHDSIYMTLCKNWTVLLEMRRNSRELFGMREIFYIYFCVGITPGPSLYILSMKSTIELYSKHLVLFFCKFFLFVYLLFLFFLKKDKCLQLACRGTKKK